MFTRREFLKLALGAFCVPQLPDIERYDTQNAPELPGQVWVFPLAFPAWFPVEPRIPDPLEQRVYVPIA